VTPDDFAGLVGDTIVHATYAVNLPSITTLGLMPPAMLAARAGVDTATLIRRTTPPRFVIDGRTVRLNDQRQLEKGRNQPFLDGHTLDSWSAQLDARVFFLPGREADATPFVRSLGPDAQLIRLDSRRFFAAFAPDLWLSPINSGNADRRAALRGDWIYVPVSASVVDFRRNRMRRGLKSTADSVAEISIRHPIPPDLLAQLTAAAEPRP
jgi:hypothetical protein